MEAGPAPIFYELNIETLYVHVLELDSFLFFSFEKNFALILNTLSRTDTGLSWLTGHSSTITVHLSHTNYLKSMKKS